MSDEFVPYLKGDLDARQHRIYNLPDPVDNNEVATKAYVDAGGGSQSPLVKAEYTFADVILDGGGTAYLPTFVTLLDNDVLFGAGVVVTEDFNDSQVGGLYPTVQADLLNSGPDLSGGTAPTVLVPTSGLIVLRGDTATFAQGVQLPIVVVAPGSGPVEVGVVMSTGNQWAGDGTTGALTAYALVARA